MQGRKAPGVSPIEKLVAWHLGTFFYFYVFFFVIAWPSVLVRDDWGEGCVLRLTDFSSVQPSGKIAPV